MRGLSCPSHRPPTSAADHGVMRTWVKPLLLVLVTLPIVGYVAGTLGAAPTEPVPRSPVILRDADPPVPPEPMVPRRQEPKPPPPPGPDTDHADTDDDDADADDDEARVVKPSPVRVDDDVAPDDEGDDDGRDDGADDDTSRDD